MSKRKAIMELLDKIGINYKRIEGKSNDFYVIFYETSSEKVIKLGIAVDNSMFVIYIPEIQKFDARKKCSKLKELNELNSMLIYGTCFIHESENYVSYKISQSIEGDAKITEEQLKDYFGAISKAVDKLSIPKESSKTKATVII